MHSLPVFLRLADRPVILLGEGEAADAKRRLLERCGARICDEGAQAAVAFVAIDDDAAADAAIVRLRARGILINATDRPEHCDFTLPAIVDRSPVLVAIGTGGASAGLAKALRIALETLLPARLGSLATALSETRAKLRARWPDARTRRLALDAALSPGGPLDPLGDPIDVDVWLAQQMETENALVTLRPRSADPDDLSLREARLLGRADRIYHPPHLPPAILARARADAARIRCDAPPTSVPPGLSLWLEID